MIGFCNNSSRWQRTKTCYSGHLPFDEKVVWREVLSLGPEKKEELAIRPFEDLPILPDVKQHKNLNFNPCTTNASRK